MEKIDDAIFIQFLEKGNEKAFSTLYDHYWEALFLYVVRILGEKDDAMDVVQDTLITLWKQRDHMHEVKSLKAYLYSIARYKALRHIRLNIQKRDYLSSLLNFFEEYSESPEEQFISNELQMIINDEVSRLPPKMREVYRLSREQQLSYKEIASLLNISDKTVKKQISNSLKIIRLRIDNGLLSAVLLLLLLKEL